jgi:Mycolic acid cyclopropane synthetase
LLREGQGNRVKKSCGDQACEEVIIPCGNFAFEAQAVFTGSFSDQVVGPLGVDFMLRYVFPDGEAPAISVTLRAAEAGGFEVRDVENLRDHYVYTLRHWLRRLEQHAEAARRIAGDITYRTWRLYVLMALREMAVGTANVHQTLLLKREKGQNSLPLRREDWYGAVTTRSSIDLDGSM